MNSIAPTSRPRRRLGGDEHGRVGRRARGRARRAAGCRPTARRSGASGPVQAMSYSAMSSSARRRRAARSMRPSACPRPRSSRARFSATLSVEHAAGVVAVLGDEADAGGAHRPGPCRWHGDAVDLDARRRRAAAGCRARRPAPPGRCPRRRRRRRSRRRARRGRDGRARCDRWPVATASRMRSAGRRRRTTCASTASVLSASAASSTSPERQRFAPQRDRAPDHRLGERPGVGVRRRHGVDDAAAAQDRDDVGGVEDLVELVADEGDGLALGGDGDAQHGEQLLGLLGREHRRRLVEDDDVGVAAQALDDLDPLAHPGGEVADDGVGIEAEPVAIADLADEVARRADGRGGRARRAPRSPTRAARRRG